MMRRSISKARNNLENTLSSLSEIVEVLIVHPEADGHKMINATISTTHAHTEYLKMLLNMAPGFDADNFADKLNDVDQALLDHINDYESTRAEDIISKFENTTERFTAFYSRIDLVEHLIPLISKSLDINISIYSDNIIKRSIEFSPEYKQASISILSYFSEVISKKYPDMEVGVTIEQSKDKVTLIITTPEGKKEVIEQELNSYGLVVTGKLDPDEYLTNKIDALSLKYKLDMAAMEIRHTQELLASERSQYGARIKSLEENIQLLSTILDREKYLQHEIIAEIKELSLQSTGALKTSIENLISLLADINSENKEITMVALKSIKNENASVFDKINEIIIKGSMQGASGNYLYAWLQELQKLC